MSGDDYYNNEVYGGDPDARTGSDENGGYKDGSVYEEDEAA